MMPASPKEDFMQMGIRVLSLALWASLFVTSVASADQPADKAGERTATPRVLKFSGSLSSDPSVHFEPGPVGITFAIYKERGDETPLWVGTQNVTIDEQGRFTVLLGESEDNAVPLDLFSSGEARWIGMQRIPEREGERIMLASVPYALKAADAETLGGKPLSAFVLAPASDGSTSASGKKKLTPVVNGAAGYIAKFIDATNIDNSILFESAGRIGLSTTSPQGPLHINSVMLYRNGGVGSIQTGMNPGIMLENAATNTTVLLSENNGFTVFASNSATVPLSGSDLRLVVRPTGNVGISANNPQAPLHIGTTRLYRSLNVAAVQTGTNPGLMLENPATNSTVALTENNGLSIYATSSSTLPFTGSDLKMVLTTAGNVGIGTGAPSQKLDVVGSVALSGNLALPATASGGAAGVITLSGASFAHSFGAGSAFVGPYAGNFTMTGYQNTASGYFALHSNTTGNSNTASGYAALNSNTTGNSNTASGSGALQNNNGFDNTASGASALVDNTTGNSNTASGSGALNKNTTGYSNTASGYAALLSNTTGFNNTASGQGALYYNTTGTGNTAVGYGAGQSLTTGNNNIDIGNNGVAAESGTIRIGTAVTHTKAFLAGVRGITTGVQDGLTVLIDSNGQLGTTSSSARVKREIAGIGEASSALLQLRPVSFLYRNDRVGIRQYGLIAEEVAEVMPELVQFSHTGEAETVRYHFLAPLLLNELQKQQRTIEEQRELITMLASRLTALEEQSRDRKAENKFVK
jgi:hypothetical protein